MCGTHTSAPSAASARHAGRARDARRREERGRVDRLGEAPRRLGRAVVAGRHVREHDLEPRARRARERVDRLARVRDAELLVVRRGRRAEEVEHARAARRRGVGRRRGLLLLLLLASGERAEGEVHEERERARAGDGEDRVRELGHVESVVLRAYKLGPTQQLVSCVDAVLSHLRLQTLSSKLPWLRPRLAGLGDVLGS